MSMTSSSTPLHLTPNQVLQVRVANSARVMAIDEGQLWTYLQELGIESADTEDGLALLESETTQEGDARKIMVDNGKVKIARFKAGWAVLKGKAQTPAKPDTSDFSKLVEVLKPVSQLSDRDVIQKYSPECNQDILDHLTKVSNGRPFIVFKEDGLVDVDTSVVLLREARRRETPAQYPVVEGTKTTLQRTYRVGEFPMNFTEECPFHSDVNLVNGYCDRCGNTWTGIDESDRVLLRLAVNLGLIGTDVATITYWNTAFKTDAVKAHQMLLDIPKLELEYRERKEDNRLPVLKKRMSRSKSGVSDPFYVNKTY